VTKNHIKTYLVVLLMVSAVIGLLAVGKDLSPGQSQQQPQTTPRPVDLSFYTPPDPTLSYSSVKPSPVKNAVLLIGDGMGLSQVAAASIQVAGANGKLYLERLPFTGLIKTHSLNSLVTDSAAAGTALATGIKTNNAVISTAPNGRELITILEAASQKAMATGLVVTCMVTHATPACFAAHVPSRYNQRAIAYDLLENRVNVLFGGGKAVFLPQQVSQTQPTDAAQQGRRDLLAEAQAAGYQFVQTSQQLADADGDHVLALFQNGHLTTRQGQPTLAQMTAKAIKLLSKNKNGFFLMVEGSQIDWACHSNNADRAIRQTLLFDLAVKEAMDFAVEDKHTIVVVTADHETGGMAINGGSLDGIELDIAWTSGGHTAVPVPVYVFGPHAEQFTGVYDNTELCRKLAKLLQLKVLARSNH